jgi:AraC family transcriptional regulator
MRAETLASGPGWSVSNVCCSLGPTDRRFEERHDSVCIAAVMQGSFRYRTTQGSGTLVRGAVLLGNYQSCFECGHDHGAGDRCLSFMFDPAYFEAILSSIPNVRTGNFKLPRLPPLMSLTRVLAGAELASSTLVPAGLEQLGLDLAGLVVALLADDVPPQRETSHRDERRIADVLRLITDCPDESTLSIGEMAKHVAMSPYHFLRVFRDVTGMTPHQFILRARLQDAAVQLRSSTKPVTDIALDTGFSDLSTFNRQFRSVIGMTPTAYRCFRQPNLLSSD